MGWSVTLWLLIVALPLLGLGHLIGDCLSTRGLMGPSTKAVLAQDWQRSMLPGGISPQVPSPQGSVAGAVSMGVGRGSAGVWDRHLLLLEPSHLPRAS